jgi:DOPA 4,5-dioxygenase
VAQEPGLIIRDWHAHFYFDPHQAEEVRAVCEQMRDYLGVPMGRIHLRPIGPHPRGSCQITVPRRLVCEALEWLYVNRGPFTVMVHGNSGDDWLDHTRHVLWFGEAEPLNLTIFERKGPASGERVTDRVETGD